MSKDKRVALITGASSGMGKDFALRLIAEGYTVYAAARRVDRMKDIEAAGGSILALDVTDDASLVAQNRAITVATWPARCFSCADI